MREFEIYLDFVGVDTDPDRPKSEFSDMLIRLKYFNI